MKPETDTSARTDNQCRCDISSTPAIPESSAGSIERQPEPKLETSSLQSADNEQLIVLDDTWSPNNGHSPPLAAPRPAYTLFSTLLI